MIVPKNRFRSFLHYLLISCLWTPAYLTVPSPVQARHIHDDFIIVRAEQSDTLSSLAARYLSDSSKDWLIAEFNGIKTVRPGQELVIPLKPYEWGGLRVNGYKTVPILLYHRISNTQTDELTVSRTAFEEQMRFLYENGYRMITLDQLMDFLHFKGSLPEKSVLITFDRGWRSVYEVAYPLMKRYGFPATLFVHTDFVGTEEALTWEQLREMWGNNFDVQCNTRTYRNLTEPEENETFKDYLFAIEKEISGSKRVIRQRLNKECMSLAYPYGETNNLVIALLKKHGYSAAFTSRGGSNPFFVNNYMIKRSLILPQHDLETFKRTLVVFIEKTLK